MTIFVINPNSSQHVTDGIDQAIDTMRAVSPVPIQTVTSKEGPPGIETQAHIDGVIPHLLTLCDQLEDQASAFVNACYSDPGLNVLRRQSAHPVIGIGEAAILTALTMGNHFGIVSILPASVPRHLRQVSAIGVRSRLADDQALGLSVLELADKESTYERLKTVGTSLRDDGGADVVILGCAGLADHRDNLEEFLGIPVVEPCQAATAMAIGRIALQTARKDKT